MRRGTVVGITALGVAVLAVPLLWGNNHQHEQQRQIKTASEEKYAKQHILNADVQSTVNMSLLDIKQDMEAAITKYNQLTPEQIKAKLQEFVREHPHYEYVCWTNAAKKQTIANGTVPHPDDAAQYKQLKSLVRSGEIHVGRHDDYRSDTILINGKPHVVIGLASKQLNGGIVAIVNQHIVNNVRSHQQRNLRLIPYPRESKYQVKSVDTNTMEDIPVNDGEDNQGTSHYYKDEIVVRFRKPPSDAQLAQIRNDINCRSVRKTGYTHIFKSKSMSAVQLKQYFAQYNPIYIEPHYLYMTNDLKRADGTPTSLRAPVFQPSSLSSNDNSKSSAVEPNDALYKPYQWNLPLIHANQGWNLSKGKKSVIIAVVDTGVDMNHRDLKDKLLKGYNVFAPDKPPQDDVGHGTHVAGIIGAQVNNQEGIAGMTWHNPIMPIKVLDGSGSGTSYSVAEGIIWAADHGAKVINLSLGNYAQGAFLHDAIKYAYNKDVVLIAATGNDNTGQPGYPAAYSEVFAVSATNQDKTKAEYSNYGDYVDVVAPGTTIASTYPQNQYAALSGTSMASPHVTALAGLIRSINPSLKNTEVYDIMRKSVADIGSSGKDIYFGYGLIDVERSLSLASQSNQSLSLYPQNVDRMLNRIVASFLAK
ncbi:S8 family peptidase [Paenibacillus taiwanensis]|uniref:S8 family peptidase n=1 Tax=Paenibacillus taiwanensis TaxID=401638 RepID=UPI00040EACF4|nr:S8 family peptidase [Paenibacillus taiwanensis]